MGDYHDEGFAEAAAAEVSAGMLGGTCPSCHQSSSWGDEPCPMCLEIEALKTALRDIAYNAENQDMGHAVFRKKAYECAQHALSS